MTKRNIMSILLLFVFMFLVSCASVEPEQDGESVPQESGAVERLPVDETERPEPTTEPMPEVPTSPAAEQLLMTLVES